MGCVEDSHVSFQRVPWNISEMPNCHTNFQLLSNNIEDFVVFLHFFLIVLWVVLSLSFLYCVCLCLCQILVIYRLNTVLRNDNYA
jgi:hypothetical protein